MSVEMTTDGKNILAKIPYFNGRGPGLAKSISGAKPVWDETVTPHKFLYWRYPLTMETCKRFRRVFGDDLEISPVLADWARAELRRNAEIDDMRRGVAELTRVPQEAPALYEAVSSRHYQLAGAAFLAATGQGCLGDDPGLGKTLQALATLIEADVTTILVGCRRTAVRSVWQLETKRWAPTIKTFVAQGPREQREATMAAFQAYQGGRKMLIVNIEMWRAKRVFVCPENCNEDQGCPSKSKHRYQSNAEWPYLHSEKWDALVLDESHNLLASTANYQSKRITQGRYGAVMIRRNLRKGGLALALSGSFSRSKPPKAWGTMNWVRPDVFGSFWRFAEAHFDVTDDGYGRKVSDEPLDIEAYYAALRPYYLARTKEDAAPDLPPIQYAGTYLNDDENGLKGIWLEMEPKQASSYRQMARDAEARIEGGRLLAPGVLAEITRLRQFACSAQKLEGGEVYPVLPSCKIEWVLDFLHEEPGKVVIASSFTRLINMLAKVLKDEFGAEYAEVITGETSDRDRLRVQQTFQDPHSKLQVVVVNSRAGGESITLDAADSLVFLDLPWTDDEIKQVESRIHRVSRIHSVTIYRLFSLGTVDQWIAGLTDEQRKLLKAIHPATIELAKEMLAA